MIKVEKLLSLSKLYEYWKNTLNIPTRAITVLCNNDINSLDDLLKSDIKKIGAQRNFGPRSFLEVKKAVFEKTGVEIWKDVDVDKFKKLQYIKEIPTWKRRW